MSDSNVQTFQTFCDWGQGLECKVKVGVSKHGRIKVNYSFYTENKAHYWSKRSSWDQLTSGQSVPYCR